MIITIIGLGLIGGSLAKDLRANGFATELLGVDVNEAHEAQALSLGLIDECPPLEHACMKADVVVLTVPVNAVISLLPEVLGHIRSTAVVVEMGSTKEEIANSIREHKARKQVVLAHPMAGTEFSGPSAAVNNLFHSKAAIIADRADSTPEAAQLIERLFKSLFMRVIYMDSQEHDVHAAYVSHISHITSYVLSLTVLEKEKSAQNIFDMASGGFTSTVRLAKSSPTMWRDVFMQNTDNVLDVLDSYLEKMQEFRSLIAEDKFEDLHKRMAAANEIGKILSKHKKVPLQS
ncbi:MAG: prephenate dehydrogenase [Bacteroidota bacterium]